MDYTQSNSFATDAGTAQRMHLQAQAVPTAVTDADMNMLIWELMEIQKAGGVAAAAFDKAVPATYQKLLTALRAAGVFQTPAQFDNTTRAATTAFVKRAGQQFSGNLFTGTTVLTAADVGKLIVPNVASAAITLPLAAASGAESILTFHSQVACTISRQGAENIIQNGASITSLSLGAGDTVTLMGFGTGAGWYIVSGTASDATSAAFANTKVDSGYTRLPNGVIMQWGVIADGSWVSGTYRTFNYPIAFPNGALTLVCSPANPALPFTRSNANSISNSQLQIAIETTGSYTVRYIAIGW